MSLTSSIYRSVYEGYNYRLRTIAGGRWRDNCNPTSIIILLTELCNAKCVHCDIWKNRGKEDSPTEEQWKQVMSDLRTWLGPVQLTITGGEAMLKPYAIDLVAHGSSLGLFQEILTHGYWEDQTKIEKLALAKPSRVTVSLDGIGEVHSRIRGREKFWDRTSRSIETLKRMRKEHQLPYTVRLKNVIMDHNLTETIEIARMANMEGMDCFFQAIEQNYNTPDDPQWFMHSENWPQNPGKAIENVRELIKLKRQGWRIANSYAQLEVMIPYFQDPDAHRMTMTMHSAHEKKTQCAALVNMQLQANGDVTVCTGAQPIGNVKEQSIKNIWQARPHLWDQGCCLERRCSPAELQNIQAATPSLIGISSHKD